MSKKRRKKTATNTKIQVKAPKRKRTSADNKRAIIIVVCVIVGLIVAFGAIFGIVTAVKNAKAVIYFEGVRVDEGVANYLASYYKTQYLAALRKSGVTHAKDSPTFWDSYFEDGKTYGEFLQSSTETFIRDLVAANAIFDNELVLSDEDKQKIDTAINDVLTYRADGSKKRFNEIAEKFGFDYNDFKHAAEMIYKGWCASAKLFGESGENMVSFPEECEEYYNNYSHVYLLFVRTEEVFDTDENGNIKDDGLGNAAMRPLNPEEKAQKERRLAEIREAIAGINADTVTAARYFELLEKYDEGDSDSHQKGYYFHADAKYTKDFATEVSADVVRTSLNLKEGQCYELETSIGVCFIYKTEREAAAYENTSATWCFSDFYNLCADRMFDKMLAEHGAKIEFREKWKNINIIEMPYNSELIAKF